MTGGYFISSDGYFMAVIIVNKTDEPNMRKALGITLQASMAFGDVTLKKLKAKNHHALLWITDMNKDVPEWKGRMTTKRIKALLSRRQDAGEIELKPFTEETFKELGMEKERKT